MGLTEKDKITSSTFGCYTFSLNVMREKLPRDIFQSLRQTIQTGKKLDPAIANIVAHAMKEWALENGATHYCHWFQPMTGTTAEKHDAFLTRDKDGVLIERFSGSQLIQSEPDASSFPSGGMRTTFEARGYTAWDPGSPAFLLDGPHGKTLCIPSVYISYYGEALDEKTPLLRSREVLNKASLRILRLLGNQKAQSVYPVIGAEQEYFLVDKKLYEEREDLMLCGRTLIGALPPKGQQLEDHYFGSIPERVLEYMQELEHELYELGIPIKTRHNEVAPHQFEIAPIYEEANIAADHNLLTMEVMRKVAIRKGLALLIHEKPFAGVNGSGKHSNWSLFDSEGNNLLEPGKDPLANLQFLVFLVATIRAVHRRAAILRCSVASAANDHRLGANEAPPAIMSVFVGQMLERILGSIEEGDVKEANEDKILSLGISHLPEISRDNTDRNRTSPFAFTGNKFEFRALGSSSPVSFPNTVLNCAVAEALDELASLIEQKEQRGTELKVAIMEALRDIIVLSKSIRFEGDNYSDAWHKEAIKRGLISLRNTPEALQVMLEDSNQQMFITREVFTKEELNARFWIKLELYRKQISIEARTMLLIAKTKVIPACYEHELLLSKAITKMQQALQGTGVPSLLQRQTDELVDYASSVEHLLEELSHLQEAVDQFDLVEEHEVNITRKAESLLYAMQQVRKLIDALERNTDKEFWAMPTYLDLLFRI